MLVRSEKYSEVHCWFEAWGSVERCQDTRIRAREDPEERRLG
jgi:hypothetical protein